MFTRERRQEVLLRLQRDGRVEVGALAQELGVSEDTVRRDLRALAADGYLQKTHGGAIALDPARMPWNARAHLAAGAKEAIGAAAAQLVRPGQTILLDTGSTVLSLVHALVAAREVRPLTVVTNSLDAAAALDADPDITVHVTGGEWDRRSRFLTGPAAVAGVQRYRADWAFLGTCALDPGAGATSVDAGDAAVKVAMAGNAAQVAVLADRTKLGTTATHLVLAPEAIDVLVTDVDDVAQQWRPHPGTAVVVVDPLGDDGRATTAPTSEDIPEALAATGPPPSGENSTGRRQTARSAAPPLTDR
ncbi:DeoR/GlpR family transcriptional regulator of sugar metabolism [Kineococcus radiotolerans]|uniref:Lactose phosphotransferase system repressor n=1 Tax=Kineococcus radiotolerans TaxID=131568 RepID=A0A7W4TQZ0_KINRA|nr:DeoR/GlpR family DNA-binding transcription regulator [Kineococcus radiotolerans]MBB2903325.1 DeoR/GlpR family transcriptional regulator of sugar metabolism [Kineococcus radiotolerans]